MALVSAERTVSTNKKGVNIRIFATLHETYTAKDTQEADIVQPENRHTRHLAFTVFTGDESTHHEVPLREEIGLDGDILRDLPKKERRRLAKLARIVISHGTTEKEEAEKITRRHFCIYPKEVSHKNFKLIGKLK